ncbi:amidohydrolase family protein [Hephaestia sp. GCM10023244]|uniref:amidohydrolase family protein n=1 Tax=unclassified Hephaestia TaxID=2631281 RepID=UPI0020777176|nr:amidohydrolase family protein [Hephaestia sp. MAHUQ-44]MCM8730274.1 amidohydrolase family protein [Hephaestia sp. MAHUQ-44]
MNIVDTHAHFWDVERIDYPWIEAGSPFDRSFSLEDYQRASAAVPIERMVFVECDAHPRCSVVEAEWVTGLAKADPRIQAIVARVPLLADDAAARLEAVAAMPLVRGVRDNIQGQAPGFALHDSFVRGVRDVARCGLHFELCLKHHQLDETIELVRRCPEVRFVLDHCAKPDIATGLREPWRSQITEMAGLPNIVCKISGLVTEADWTRWEPEEVLWYARAAAEAFGPERIMFGSDWPVNEVAGGYERWFQLAKDLASAWDQRDRDRFFRGNAERIYRLG